MTNPIWPKEVYRLDTCIVHILGRKSDSIIYGDTSRWCFTENIFWWHIEQPQNSNVLTINSWTVSRRSKFINKIVCTNLLEFLFEIINYAVVILLSRSWIKYVATITNKGKTLQCALCSLMVNNPLGINVDYIPGELNKSADANDIYNVSIY